MRMFLFASIAAVAALATTLSIVPANAEQASVAEIEAGCPAELPVIQVANANFVVLDRSSLTKDCLAAIYIQNGDSDEASNGDK